MILFRYKNKRLDIDFLKSNEDYPKKKYEFTKGSDYWILQLPGLFCQAIILTWFVEFNKGVDNE